MAQKLVTVDDIDGTGDATSCTFSLGKEQWEIDLNDENAAKLREALEPFIAKARKKGRAKNGSRRTTGANSGDVRAWAQRNGHTVPSRGRIPQVVIDAYNESNGK